MCYPDEKLGKKQCSWELIRFLSMKPRPRCEAVKWKVKVAKDVPMFGGRTLYLCDYHKNNLALRYEKVDKINGEK